MSDIPYIKINDDREKAECRGKYINYTYIGDNLFISNAELERKFSEEQRRNPGMPAKDILKKIEGVGREEIEIDNDKENKIFGLVEKSFADFELSPRDKAVLVSRMAHIAKSPEIMIQKLYIALNDEKKINPEFITHEFITKFYSEKE